MNIQATGFQGLCVLSPSVFADSRGYFFESYNQAVFAQSGLDYVWVQDNQSHSTHGVIRGLHFQQAPYAQTKLIRVLQGEILDVVVDLRRGEPSFGKTFSIVLSSTNKLQLLVPRGFAHGFSVLSETADVLYKCDQVYHKQAESGIVFNDPALSIDWQLPDNEMIVSEKDLILPTFRDADAIF